MCEGHTTVYSLSLLFVPLCVLLQIERVAFFVLVFFPFPLLFSNLFFLLFLFLVLFCFVYLKLSQSSLQLSSALKDGSGRQESTASQPARVPQKEQQQQQSQPPLAPGLARLFGRRRSGDCADSLKQSAKGLFHAKGLLSRGNTQGKYNFIFSFYFFLFFYKYQLDIIEGREGYMYVLRIVYNLVRA